jgi:hypothetical protein
MTKTGKGLSNHQAMVKKVINRANSLRALMAANKNTRTYQANKASQAENTTQDNGKEKAQGKVMDNKLKQAEPIQSYSSLLCPKTIPKEIIDLNHDADALKDELDNNFALVVRAPYDCTRVTFREHRLLTALITTL